MNKSQMLLKALVFHKNKFIARLSYKYHSYKYRNFIKPIISIEETIIKILNGKLSLARFGDGEIRIINGDSIEFQEYNSDLAQDLINVLQSNKSDLIVGIPDVFRSLKPYQNEVAYFWAKHLNKYYLIWVKFLRPKGTYYNAFVSRPYILYKDKTNSGEYFNLIKKIWCKKEILLIEGNKSRLGVGNDLFAESLKLERILCPSTNAYLIHQQIIEVVEKYARDKLVLIALGPTATVLAYKLSLKGYQAIDIGHIDIEYEWYNLGVQIRVDIKNKHTNEVIGNNAPESIQDVEYNKQIVFQF